MKKREILFENILSDKTGEGTLIEVLLNRNVFNAVFTVILVIAAVAVSYLAFFSLVKNSFFVKKAVANMSQVLIEGGERGLILDRFDRPLLGNIPSLNLILLPQSLPEEIRETSEVLKALRLITNLEEDDWVSLLSEVKTGAKNRLLVKKNLTLEEIKNV